MAGVLMENKARGSASFKKALNKAADYAKNPSRLISLVEDASRKDASRQDPLDEAWSFLKACLRMLRAYAKGEYTVVPRQSLVLIIASIVYFVMPADAIPDFIPALGLVDDAALLGWTLKAVKSTINDFRSWESVQAHEQEDQQQSSSV